MFYDYYRGNFSEEHVLCQTFLFKLTLQILSSYLCTELDDHRLNSSGEIVSQFYQ